MVTVDNRVQFEVNLETAQRAGLKLAAQFVKLARKVKGKKTVILCLSGRGDKDMNTIKDLLFK